MVRTAGLYRKRRSWGKEIETQGLERFRGVLRGAWYLQCWGSLVGSVHFGMLISISVIFPEFLQCT